MTHPASGHPILVYSIALVVLGSLGEVKADVAASLFTSELVEAIAQVTTGRKQPNLVFSIGQKGRAPYVCIKFLVAGQVEHRPSSSRAKGNMRRKFMHLIRAPGIDHHSNVASFLCDREEANCRGDPATKGHKATGSECQQESFPELAVRAKQRVPIWLDEAGIFVDMFNLLTAESQQVEVGKDAGNFRRGDTPYVLRPN